MVYLQMTRLIRLDDFYWSVHKSVMDFQVRSPISLMYTRDVPASTF